jgi:hypothetical protein
MSMIVTPLDVFSVSPLIVKRETRLTSVELLAGEWYRYTYPLVAKLGSSAMPVRPSSPPV